MSRLFYNRLLIGFGVMFTIVVGAMVLFLDVHWSMTATSAIVVAVCLYSYYLLWVRQE